ncbi:RICIN domain-containing protein [Nocardia sp. NPDC004278]
MTINMPSSTRRPFKENLENKNKFRAGVAVIAAALASTVVWGPAAQAEPVAPDSETYYEIHVQHSHLCLDVADVRYDHGAPVLQARCENGRNQNWKLVKSEFRAGYFMVQVKHSKKCLDVVDFRLDHGAPVVQADCRDTDNQQWKLEPVGNDAPLYYHLINYNSEQCLDVQDSSVAHGANVIQGNCWDGSNQRWQFDKK